MRWLMMPCLVAAGMAAAPGVHAGEPIVGLAGMKYRRAYLPALEAIGAQGELISGAELEDGGALDRYTAVVIVTQGDPGQENIGLTQGAQAAVAAFVAGGKRVLCSYGCAPPAEVLAGRFDMAGPGPDWLVADNTHPITADLRVGQVVRYKAYRFAVSGVAEPGQVLVREIGGGPALTVVAHGKGELIQTCGDLAATGGYDATTAELRDRLLLYLVHGRVQAHFGPTLATDAEPLPHPKRYRTSRRLAVNGRQQAQGLFDLDVTQPCRTAVPNGYTVAAQQGAWVVKPGNGRTAFGPWLRLALGHAEVGQGQSVRLAWRARLTGAGTSRLARAWAELRFLGPNGGEIAHRNIATGTVIPGVRSQTASCRAVAPEGTVKATLTLGAVIPTGTLSVESLKLVRARTPDEVFASEEALTSRIAGHPRLLLDPQTLERLPARVRDDRRGTFGASAASLFAAIRGRAVRYLDEDAITFGEKTLPWPPTAMPTKGGGLSWNPLAGAIAERLKSLSLVYAATRDPRCGRRTAELLVAICQWPQWSDPVNTYIALEIGNISIAAALAYDLVHDVLTEGERQVVQQGIRRNALMPLYSQLSEGMGQTNGPALWATALGFCGIATLGEVQGGATCARLAEDCLLSYWDGRHNDHRSEGQGYDSWAYGLLILLADSLDRNLGVDHLDHPFLPVMPRFATAFLAGDRRHCAWFADAGGTTRYVTWHFPMTLLAARCRDGLAGWYLQETQTLGFTGHDHYKLLFTDPSIPVKAPSDDEPGVVLPRLGWAALRSGWERDGTLIALQASSAAQGHSHRDQNNVLIYRGGVNLAMDCGYASALGGALREFARGTVGHNSVLVDGKGQSAKRGHVPYFASTRAVDYAMGDATPAYSRTLLSRFHRHLVYVKPDLLLMVDDLRATDGRRAFQWLLHPHSWGDEAEVTRNGGALQVGVPPAPGDVRVVKGDRSMRLRYLSPTGIRSEYVVYPGAEKYRPYLRARTPAAESTVIVTLCEFDQTRAQDVQCRVQDERVEVAFRTAGGSMRIVLRLSTGRGRSPQLKITRDGKAVLDRTDLSIPKNTPG